MALKRIFYWCFSAVIWMISGGLIYVSFLLIFLAPVLGMRGDIDFLDFSPAQKRLAYLQEAAIYAVGILIIALVSIALYWRKRFLMRVLHFNLDSKANSAHA